ncbi:MAG: hypothetical protein VZR73_16070, partial [Acutalibacteraceae bacterium]|nr:hypothetical protein [Acutalibacteraceae bacterium]
MEPEGEETPPQLPFEYTEQVYPVAFQEILLQDPPMVYNPQVKLPIGVSPEVAINEPYSNLITSTCGFWYVIVFFSSPVTSRRLLSVGFDTFTC